VKSDFFTIGSRGEQLNRTGDQRQFAVPLQRLDSIW
jgi:hypothetical protein